MLDPKYIPLFLGGFIASVALALPPVRPVLPPVEYLDTETVTNVPFTAWQEHLRHFTFTFQIPTISTVSQADS